MNNTKNKVVILELTTENTTQCTQLLKDNGYQVEVQSRAYAPASIPVGKYSNVIEIDLNITKSIKKNKDNILVQDTCRYLKNNIYNKLILNDIASFMGSNRSKLAATFKRVLGVGVFEWLRKQRMLKAKSLLIHSDLSIQEIGFEVGYENSANFSSVYKKQFGFSPRQQRNLSKVEVITHSKVFHT
ncbi:MAG: helix-turn-helix transcriptional regulator [Colwellia sp.]|nr:helix-turn-helix transcriptional regulator [Colwellia sp.]